MRPRSETRKALTTASALLLASSLGSSLARAEEVSHDKARRRLAAWSERGPYGDFFATTMLGEGLRFNNPYRLSHQLGASAESLSSTAPYLDLAVGVTTGKPNGVQHGVRLAWSISLSGVPQQVVTPAYLALLRLGDAWFLYGWAGLPLVATPDFNMGGELALGGTWLARAGLGITAAVVVDGFYGAGTRETFAAFYPVISGQLGLAVSYEVLP
ncbi:MAG TPA: hypothetical protein VJT73_07620 [Polyangiaceae bacterium]|nr:hypothetical protein [Polyangiaceae bacterium]